MGLDVCECGGAPQVTHDTLSGLYSVYCADCNSSTPGHSQIRDAQRMWNNWCRRQEYCLPIDAN